MRKAWASALWVKHVKQNLAPVAGAHLDDLSCMVLNLCILHNSSIDSQWLGIERVLSTVRCISKSGSLFTGIHVGPPIRMVVDPPFQVTFQNVELNRFTPFKRRIGKPRQKWLTTGMESAWRKHDGFE